MVYEITSDLECSFQGYFKVIIEFFNSIPWIIAQGRIEYLITNVFLMICGALIWGIFRFFKVWGQRYGFICKNQRWPWKWSSSSEQNSWIYGTIDVKRLLPKVFLLNFRKILKMEKTFWFSLHKFKQRNDTTAAIHNLNVKFFAVSKLGPENERFLLILRLTLIPP